MRHFLLFLVFLGFSASSIALEIPKRPDGYVTDKAGLLSPTVKNQLENLLSNFEKETTNQIIVVTLESLEDASLEDFSIRLAEAWKPGQKGRDNGIILIIFKKEQKIRIEVGYGLEGVVPDALGGQIIQKLIVPHFRKGDFESGVLAGVGGLIMASKGEFAPQKRQRGRRELTPAEIEALKAKAKAFSKFVFALIFVLFIVDLFRYRKYRKGHRDYRSGYSFWGWWFRFALLLFVLNIAFRIAFYALLFSRGGYHGGRSGFGGFSGGGGSFGGGGASGGW